MDKTAGIDLHKKLNAPVSEGERLYTIYAEFHADFTFAKSAAHKNSGYTIENKQ